ncbi:MAG TPA: hypothetical protein PKD60_12265, partial [Turneriella sp.]|nr:hypothetical protein [Turneriella sp.]
MRRQFILALPFLVATYCSQPTKEKIDLSKARASLRLADGSTISRDSSEEYSPYLVKMDDGHLVLVFGSNRTDCGSCSGHNLFFARSLTVFDGL